MNLNEQEELLEILGRNKVEAYIKPSNRNGPTLVVMLEYPLRDIVDYKGLELRLINIKELGNEGL